MNRLKLVLFAMAVAPATWLVINAPDDAAAQSGRRTGPQAEATFEQRFWTHLTNRSYRDWSPLPGRTGDFLEGQKPHGAFVKLYLNRVAAGNFQDLPDGSIIVKENYGPDRQTLAAVTIMYRSEGYNPQGGDWYWIQYDGQGNVMTTPPENGSMRIAGKVSACIDCHSGSGGDDFVFLNDQQ